jgi:hypothetical protein
MGARGLKECNDIDILVNLEVWEEYKNKNWELKVGGHGSLYLSKNEIELWKDWSPGDWDVKQLIQEAEIIDGLPFVKLEKVLEWKKLIAREKDLRDIEIIEKFLLSL